MKDMEGKERGSAHGTVRVAKRTLEGEKVSEMSWVAVHIMHLCPNSSLLHIVWEVKEEKTGEGQ